MGLFFSQDVPLESAPRLQEALVRANQAILGQALMPASGRPHERHHSESPQLFVIRRRPHGNAEEDVHAGKCRLPFPKISTIQA